MVLLFKDKVDGNLLKDMLIGASKALQSNKEILNDLNVFPVPDGDTGTNMSLTLQSVVKELSSLNEITIATVSQAMSRGALKGARGNSGVILSQILRGFANIFTHEIQIDAIKFAQALRAGSDMAYKSVMKPKEGTILTIIKTVSDEAFRSSRSGADIYQLFDDIIKVGEATLERTPEMNPVLKKAGVVDAGGKGLLVILSAFRSVLNGEEIADAIVLPQEEAEAEVKPSPGLSAAAAEEVDANFPYCTEFFIINLMDYVNESVCNRFRDKLNEIGDSLVVVADADMIKVHVHTAAPGKALQFGLQLGELDNIKIENMLEQNRILKLAAASEPEKEFGLVSVAAGEGMGAIMRDLGVDEVIEGGQTMNPSTEEILSAVERIKAKTVFIFPNNANIIMAAQQVGALTDKTVHVIHTKTVPQGMASILAFNPDESAEENIKRLEEAVSTVKTGLVTYAVRDSDYDGKHINKGDIIGIYEKDIVVIGNDYNDVAAELVDIMLEDEEMLSLFYGADVPQDKADDLSSKISESHGDCEVSVYFGGQPLYYYIISAE